MTTGKISGKVSVNGEQVNTKQMKEMSGFVFQDDVILGKSLLSIFFILLLIVVVVVSIILSLFELT